MIPKTCLITNDVETTSIWHNRLCDKTGERVLKEGMPKLLELYDKLNIEVTFFITGYIAQRFPEIVKMIAPLRHEIGSHGYKHDTDNAFDVLDLKAQIDILKRAKDTLEDISGQAVISFRAPALRVNQYTAEALTQAGYLIDSSISSQRFDFFLTSGNICKLRWLFTPRLPYVTKYDNLFARGTSSILEVPVSALFIPYIGTTLRIFPGLIKILRAILNYESQMTGKPIVFLFHPNEIINERHERKLINRRAGNLISFILSDFVRTKLKEKNLGPKSLPIYERELQYFINNNYTFQTMKKYYEAFFCR